MLNHKIKGTASIYQNADAGVIDIHHQVQDRRLSSEFLIHILSLRPNNVLEMAPSADTLMLHIRDQYPRRAGTDIASALSKLCEMVIRI